MPRRPIDACWVDLVKTLTVNNPRWSATRIEQELRERAKEVGRTDYPAERKIRLIKAEITPKEQLEYRYVYWPESFGQPELPWEAASCVLELLNSYPNEQDRPTVRFACWVWRLTLAAPDLALEHRKRLAAGLTTAVTGVNGLWAAGGPEATELLRNMERTLLRPEHKWSSHLSKEAVEGVLGTAVAAEAAEFQRGLDDAMNAGAAEAARTGNRAALKEYLDRYFQRYFNPEEKDDGR